MKKRILSILLLCCMVLTMLPTVAFAAGGAVRPAATQYTYTLHYHANGGSGAPPSQSMTSSEYQVSFLISDKIPTRDGYTFKGWADSPYGEPKYLRADGYHWYCNVVNGQTNSTTIYAIWEVHNHSWGEWTSNGNGTHKRTCITDSSHTETGNCSGGKATGTEKAICETCHTAYGELLPLTKTVITTPPTLPSEGYVGEWYLDGDLKGGEAKAQGTDTVVPGSFRFKHNWGGRVYPGENRMEILFTPDDAETYATAECIVTVTGIKYTITSVIEVDLPDKPLGTAFEDLWPLPPDVAVKTNTGRTFFPIPVTWDSSSYDPNAPGEQIITGQLHVEESRYEDKLEPASTVKAIAKITLIGDESIVPTLEPPTYSRQIYSGDFCQLAFSDEYLSGGKATANGETVDGVFTLNEEQEKYGYWKRGGGLVQVGLLALKVTFTPDDLMKYTTAECTVNVDVIPRKFRQANTSYIDNKKIGTAFEDLGLPNAFYFFAEADEPNHEGSGLNANVPGIIKWDDSNYDPNSYEEQTIYGEVNRAEFEKYYIVPEGADLRGVVKITLQADPVETEITQPPVFRWKNGDFTLPDNTMFVNRIFEMGATGEGNANLADGVARVKGTDTVVPGTFSFKEDTPGWFDELGENVVTVVFTPADQHGYRKAETTIKVNVIKNTFKRCEEPDPITEKKLGTTFAGLNLPEIVVVEAIDGLRVGMEVSWDESSYDAQSTAWQIIPGTLVFDANDEHSYQQPEPAVTAAIRVKLLCSEDAPAITTTTLPGGTVGTPYHHQLQATGGGFILWELFSGELPKGLTLKQTTGKISGTPTAAGTASFTVKAENSAGSGTKELSITITKAAPAEFTISVKTDGNGTASASLAKAAANTEITLSATPNEGYRFKEWEVISGGVTIVEDKFIMPDSEVEIKAVFEEDEPPTSADPAKPNISVTGTYTYNGSEHTATVSGYDSATMNISGNTATDAGDYTVRVTSKTGRWADGSTDAVTAAWSIGKATQEAPNGLIGVAPSTVDGSDGKISNVTDKMEYRMAGERSYAACSGTEIENLPAGHYFVRYAGDNNHFASSDTVVTVGEGTPLADCTITFNAGGGSGSMDSVTVKAGANYILPECGFTAPADQEFKAWEIGDKEYKVGDSYTVNENTEIKALWENSVITPTTYTVTVTSGGNGSASADYATAAAGTEITLTATPNTGYHFKEWQVISGNVTIKDDKFTMPNDNVEVKAIFEKDAPPAPTEFTITVKTDGNGTASASPDKAVAGTEIRLTATPNTGYHFKEWQVISGDVTIKDNKFIMPSANVEIKAIFEKNAFTGGGTGTGATTYPITVNSKNGDVTASHKSAAKGTTVTLTVDPDKGCVLDTLTVLDGNNKDLKLTEKNGKYTFTMPDSKVTVEASFKEEFPDLPNSFSDLAPSDFCYDAVMWAVGRDITGGIGNYTFGPNLPCTRAQAVTFLWRAAGSPEPETRAMPFTDVPVGSYYYNAVLWAIENGITEGTSDTMFSPDATCSRAQIVTFLWRAGGSPAASGNSAFTDVASDAYYAAAVIWAEKNDITGGIGGGLFGSNNNCTRAQIVTFLYRSVK